VTSLFLPWLWKRFVGASIRKEVAAYCHVQNEMKLYFQENKKEML
jgi:hypothetical protein